MVNADFSWFALFLAGLSTVTAYTTPVGEPKGNPISAPGLNQQVPVGKPFTITWDPTTPKADTVTIVLERGPSTNVVPLYPIAQGIPNTGSFVWTPSTDLENDVTHYGIQLIVDATGQYQWSTQFGISNPGYSKPHSSSSVASTTTRSVYPASSPYSHPHSKPCTTSTIPYSSSTSTPCTTSTTEKTTSTTVPCTTTTTPVTTPPVYTHTSIVYVPPPTTTSSTAPAVSSPPSYNPGSGAGSLSAQAFGAVAGVVFAAVYAL